VSPEKNIEPENINSGENAFPYQFNVNATAIEMQRQCKTKKGKMSSNFEDFITIRVETV